MEKRKEEVNIPVEEQIEVINNYISQYNISIDNKNKLKQDLVKEHYNSIAPIDAEIKSLKNELTTVTYKKREIISNLILENIDFLILISSPCCCDGNSYRPCTRCILNTAKRNNYLDTSYIFEISLTDEIDELL
jgi:hypothetical protein